MLADIYRQARSLWPFEASKGKEHVTIRIDQIKEHSPDQVMDGFMWGDTWLLVKRNDKEALVEHHPRYTIEAGTQNFGEDFRILAFWRSDMIEEAEEFIMELEDLRRERNANSGTLSHRQTIVVNPVHERPAKRELTRESSKGAK